MGGSGRSRAEYIPTPSPIPGTTDVSSGASTDSEMFLSKALERQRRRRGVASTMRSAQGALLTGGKDKLGE